jgi:hypothetical protein
VNHKKIVPKIRDDSFLVGAKLLTASHTITTIQAFITSAASDGNMSANITGRRITLHTFGCHIHRIET